MNLEEALQEMIKGHRVRLSDWSGYWFMPYVRTIEGVAPLSTYYNEIRVFTSDGDILDSPNIDRYKDRDDWEVVIEVGFSFDMALRFLKNNKYVRRAAWPAVTVAFMEYGGLFIDTDPTGAAEIWDPKREDILANDWQFANV